MHSLYNNARDANAVTVNPWKLREDAIKGWDYLLTNELVDLVQAKDTHAIEDGMPRYAKRYIDGPLWLEGVTHLRPNPSGHNHKLLFVATSSSRGKSGGRAKLRLGVNEGARNEPVEIGRPKFVKKPKPVLSVVRLQIANCAVGFGGHEFHGSLDTPGVSFADVINRELDVPFIVLKEFLADFLSLHESELPGDMIQRGPEISHYVSDEEAHRIWRAWNRLEAIYLAHLINIRLTDDGRLAVSLHEAPVRPIEGVDVYLRPLTFERGAAEWMPLAVDLWHDGQTSGTEGEDREGSRNTHPDAAGVLRQPQENATEALNSRPTEEVASQTSRARRGDGYTAKHIRSGRTEDA